MAHPFINTSALDEATTARQLGISVPHLRAIRAANLAKKHATGPTFASISPKTSDALVVANRGSGTIDPTRTGTDPNVIAQVQQAQGGPAVAGYKALAAAVGPDLAAHVPGTIAPPGAGKLAGVTHLGPVPLPAGVLGDAAMILPFGKIARGGKAVVSALHGADDTAKVVKKAAKDYKPRTVKLGDESVQFPKSPSKVTAKGQAVYDRTSEKLTPTVDKLRTSRSPVAKATGKALTPISSRGRVPKQAGKNLRNDARRHQAGLADEIGTVKDVGKRLPFVHSSGDQAAHFWWAQLPKSHRNAEGLKLIQSKMGEELDGYTSGRVSDHLDAQLADLKEQQKAADTPWEAMQAIGRVQAVKADIPSRITDLTLNIKKLDKVIAKPPKVREDAIDALHAISNDREEILTRAGKLDPKQATERTGLVSRWLGLEPTGEEVYLGHRLSEKGGGPLPGGVSTGRTKLPEGVSKANNLRLASTGRVHQSLEPAIKDWSAAQRYDLQNHAKDELAKMGEPVHGGIKPGYVVINPKGHLIPRHWKVDQEERAIAEGFDPEDIVLPDLEEYVRNIIGEGPDAQRIIDDAHKHGHLEDLRQVPADVVKKYYGQFLPAKINVATPGVQEGAHGLAKGMDLVNNAIYTSLIYANPGYVPANLIANLIMAGAHQGAFLPVNLVRTGQLLAKGSPRLKNLIKAEVGVTGSLALAKNPLAHVASSLADAAPRISAILHEAARAGVISKVKPHLSAADFRNLEKFLTDPKHRALLNDAADRAKQAMVDFERLGPMERALAKRLLFVWPWIRGASRYPGRFALDHPVRSAALGYTIAGAPGAPQSVQDDVHAALPNVASGMPPYLAGALEAGNKTIDGHTYPAVLPTRSISPVSTPLEMIQTILDTAGSQKFAGLLNPLIEQAWHLSNRQGSSGFDAGSYGEAAKQAGERLTPDLGLAQDMIHPSAGGIYPGDATRTGRLERASRVMPVAIDPEKAFDARKKAGMVGYQDAATHELIADSKQAGLGQPPANVLDDLRWKTELDHTIKTGASYADRARITAQMFDQRYGGHGAAKQAEAITTEGEAENFYHVLRPQLYPTYSEWERQVEYVLDAQMGQQPVSAP